jgi:hypothetical protein
LPDIPSAGQPQSFKFGQSTTVTFTSLKFLERPFCKASAILSKETSLKLAFSIVNS